MSFPASHIKIASINQVIKGGSFDFQTLCRHPHVNPLSYYGPGRPGVDTDKNIIFVPSDVNNPGDFRLYDHNARKPAVWLPPDWLGWYGDLVSFGLPYKLETINLYAFADRGDYIQFNFYHTESNRNLETGLMWGGDTCRFQIPVITDTPLIDHSRQSSHKPSSTGWIVCQFLNKFTSWLSPTVDDYVYVEAFICDLAGNRKINFGTTRADGYQTLTFHKQSNPLLFGQNTNIPHPPYGYTAIFPAVSASGGAVCGYITNINQSIGSSYDFYVVAKGIFGSGVRIVELLSTDIVLTIGSTKTVCRSGVNLTQSAGIHCTGPLSSGTWNLGSIGAVTFENTTISDTPNYTQCP